MAVKRCYTKEFKLNAVKLRMNLKKGERIKCLTKNLKILPATLYNWVVLYKEKGEEGFAELEVFQ
jgi:transposase-like protein